MLKYDELLRRNSYALSGCVPQLFCLAATLELTKVTILGITVQSEPKQRGQTSALTRAALTPFKLRIIRAAVLTKLTPRSTA